jgi:hypothetical protein
MFGLSARILNGSEIKNKTINNTLIQFFLSNRKYPKAPYIKSETQLEICESKDLLNN